MSELPKTIELPQDAIFAKDQQCRQMFTSLLNTSTAARKIRLGESYDRYRIWAANVGANHSGSTYKRSLDYRLREAPTHRDQMLTVITQLLKLLSENLSYIIDSTQDEMFSSSDESSEEEEDKTAGHHTERWTPLDTEEDPVYVEDAFVTRPKPSVQRSATGLEWFSSNSKLDATLKSIELAVACLYRIPVREPASIDRLKRHQKSENFDFAIYSHFDRLHVHDRFGQANPRIITRLARMITERRRRLRYLPLHNKELQKPFIKLGMIQDQLETKDLAQGHPVDVDQPGPDSFTERLALTVPQSSLKASTFRPKETRPVPVEQFLSKPMPDIDEASSIAPTAVETGRFVFPPRPRDKNGDELSEFICPYCGIPKYLSSSRAWKKHVLADLQPYICTYIKCNEPDRMFANRREWYMHESQHYGIFSCGVEKHEQHSDPDTFCNHMKNDHDLSLMYDGDLSRLEPFQRRRERRHGTCQLCGQHTDHLEHHVGQHLERLALFSIPRIDMTVDEDIEPDGGSNLSMTNFQASRRSSPIVSHRSGSNSPDLSHKLRNAEFATEVAADPVIVPDTDHMDDWQIVKPELGIRQPADDVQRTTMLDVENKTQDNGYNECPDCGRRIKDMKAHILMHQSERLMCPVTSCEFYNRAFDSNWLRNRHVTTHYKGVLICPFCPSGPYKLSIFNHLDQFKTHLFESHPSFDTKRPPNSEAATQNRPSASESQDTAGRCRTCKVVFYKSQEFYNHLDNCIFKAVRQEETAGKYAVPLHFFGLSLSKARSDTFGHLDEQAKLLRSFYPTDSPQENSLKIVLVWGLVGSGKTHLVQEYVKTMHALYNGGIFWINGSSKSTVTESVTRIALDTGTEIDEQQAPLSTVASLLGQMEEWHQWLMVLDGVDGPDLDDVMEQLLLSAQNLVGHIIVTSRCPPHLQDWHKESAARSRPRSDSPRDYPVTGCQKLDVEVRPLSHSVSRSMIYRRFAIGDPTGQEQQKATELFEVTQGYPFALIDVLDSLQKRGSKLEDCDPWSQWRTITPFFRTVTAIEKVLWENSTREALNLIVVLSYWSSIVPRVMIESGLEVADELGIELRCSERLDSSLDHRSIVSSIWVLIRHGLVEMVDVQDTPQAVKIVPAVQNVLCGSNFKSSRGGRGPSWLVVSILVFCRSFENMRLRVTSQSSGDAQKLLDSFQSQAEMLSNHAAASPHDLSIDNAHSKLSNTIKRIEMSLRRAQRHPNHRIQSLDSGEDNRPTEHNSIWSRTSGTEVDQFSLSTDFVGLEPPDSLVRETPLPSSSSYGRREYLSYEFKKVGARGDDEIAIKEVPAPVSYIKALIASEPGRGTVLQRLHKMDPKYRARIDGQNKLLNDKEKEGSFWEPVYINNVMTRTRPNTQAVDAGEPDVGEFMVIFARRQSLEPPRISADAVAQTQVPHAANLDARTKEGKTTNEKRKSRDMKAAIVDDPFDTRESLSFRSGVPLDSNPTTAHTPRPPPSVLTPAELDAYTSSPRFTTNVGPVGRGPNTGVVGAAAKNSTRRPRSRTRRGAPGADSAGDLSAVRAVGRIVKTRRGYPTRKAVRESSPPVPTVSDSGG